MTISIRRKPILILDDERNIRDFLAIALKTYGYSVEMVGSGAEAHRCIDSETYSGLIIDYQLYNENGLTFLRYLQNSGKQIPTVVVSGGEIENIQEQAKDIAIMAFLSKPFELTTLIKVIVSAFGKANIE